MSVKGQSDWYGESPDLPSVVPATSEVELETSLSSVYKVRKFFGLRSMINFAIFLKHTYSSR